MTCKYCCRAGYSYKSIFLILKNHSIGFCLFIVAKKLSLLNVFTLLLVLCYCHFITITVPLGVCKTYAQFKVCYIEILHFYDSCGSKLKEFGLD